MMIPNPKNNKHAPLQSNQTLPPAFRRSLMSLAVGCSLAAPAPVLFAQSSGGLLEEVMVTAQRRSESVQDVPYAISAYSSDRLENRGVVNMVDIARMAAGVQVLDQGPGSRFGANNFVIRGLNTTSTESGALYTGRTVAPVSTYFGETPVFFPMKVTDIQRVEVLRGPQGTLYGSGSLGGSIRFIPNEPDPSALAGELSIQSSLTKDADDPGYGVDGMLNVPLSDRAALRVVAGFEQSAGFIDAKGLTQFDSSGDPVPANPSNPSSGFVLQPTQEDVNEAQLWYARATLLWELNEDWSAKISLHHEDQEIDAAQVHNGGWSGGRFDVSDVNVPGVPWANPNGCPGGCWGPEGATNYPSAGRNEHTWVGLEPSENDLDLFALDIQGNIGFATVTSATSYYETQWRGDVFTNYNGFTPEVRPIAYDYGYFPRFTIPTEGTADQEGFTQELRLTSTSDGQVDYVVGAFYQKIEMSQTNDGFYPGLREWFSNVLSYDFPNAEFGDQYWSFKSESESENIAVFGEVTWRVSDRWQMKVGARQFWTEFEHNVAQSLYLCGDICSSTGDPTGFDSNGSDTDDSDNLFRFNTSYNINDDTMAYFNYAQGFRRGGANGNLTVGPFASLPQYQEFESDTATNWEVGLKGTLGGMANYSIAAFLIEWDDPQIDTAAPTGAAYTVNLEEAESVGIELELQGAVGERFTYMLGYAYTDATNSKDIVLLDYVPFGIFDNTLGETLRLEDGARLPGVSEHQVSLEANYFYPMESGELRFNVNGSYRSDAVALDIGFNGLPVEYDGFTIVNATVAFHSNGAWAATLWGSNLSDEEGVTGGAPNYVYGAQGTSLFVTRPRTFGLRLEYSF